MRVPLAMVGAALLALHGSAHAQRGRSLLLLTVRDEQGHPLPHALVTVGGTDLRESSNDQGEVRIAGVPSGNRLVEVSRVGYRFTRLGLDFVGQRDTVQREVRMATAPIELDGIVATSWGRSMALVRNGFYDRQRRGLGAFMDAERLAWVRPFRTADAFRYMRGFAVVPVGHGTQFTVVSTRGYCEPRVYLDGAPVGASAADALDMVPPQDLQGIEAYNGVGTIPAEYDPTGRACAVVLLWTRTGR
jgi:hypothetical protein